MLRHFIPTSLRKRGWLGIFICEICHHIPYGIVAVVASIAVVWFWPVHSICTCCQSVGYGCIGAASTFYILHYAHIFFASVTAVLSFRRYSKSYIGGILVGALIPPIFCTISDIVFPYFGGQLMGIKMEFHLCVFTNFYALLPFIALGVCAGLALSSNRFVGTAKVFRFALGSHFLHEFVSALASLTYLVGFGYEFWWQNLGSVFVLLAVAVVIPCTLSDLVVPILCAWFASTRPSQCLRCDYHGCSKE